MLDEEVPEREGSEGGQRREVEELLGSRGTNREHVSEIEILLFLIRVRRRRHLGGKNKLSGRVERVGKETTRARKTRKERSVEACSDPQRPASPQRAKLEFSMALHSGPVLIVDNGASTIKAGFAGVPFDPLFVLPPSPLLLLAPFLLASSPSPSPPASILQSDPKLDSPIQAGEKIVRWRRDL